MKLRTSIGWALVALSSLGLSTTACDDAISVPVGTGGAGGAAGTGGAGGGDGECEAPLSACDALCVDTRYDPAHCGACDAACPDGAACLDGTCTKGPKADGEHCASDDECYGGVCLKEEDFGLAQGMCTTVCNLGLGIDCPDPDRVCSESDGVCLKLCTKGGGECPNDASECVTSEDSPNEGFCLSTCTKNADCPALGKCNVETGRCEPPEDCANKDDDDDDGFTDCEDDECSSTAACKAAIETACTAPKTATDGFAGSTSQGSMLFFGSCTGFGAKEEILRFTAGNADAVVRISVDSTKDLGFYVRSTCDDAASERTCTDMADPSSPEKGYLFASAGKSYDLFVDGFDQTQSGAYTLGLATLMTSLEVEPNNATPTANITSGATSGVVGAITKNDVDVFAVTVPSAGILTVQTTNGTSSVCDTGKGGIDTEVEILDTNGAKSLAKEDDISAGLFAPPNFCTLVGVELPAAGTYYVRIAASQEYCKDCTFDYAAAVEFKPAP
ncbi:MAG: pre-peptidase C-terminal domain-containing protein [Deltaproteobacteria bacterium]|nr:pre-peptidase C-terminal domain-containing protein [Deltaproteobacteria bacterium]